MLFAWTGCFLGVTSLQMMHSVVRRRIGRLWSWFFVITTLGLSGVGIYLGRFLRFNSWDILFRPGRLLGDIFKKNVAVTGIEFLSFENPHTATPDDPYWSANGKAYASIKEAAARGEITPEEAIAAYRRLATP